MNLLRSKGVLLLVVMGICSLSALNVRQSMAYNNPFKVSFFNTDENGEGSGESGEGSGESGEGSGESGEGSGESGEGANDQFKGYRPLDEKCEYVEYKTCDMGFSVPEFVPGIGGMYCDISFTYSITSDGVRYVCKYQGGDSNCTPIECQK